MNIIVHFLVHIGDSLEYILKIAVFLGNVHVYLPLGKAKLCPGEPLIKENLNLLNSYSLRLKIFSQ